jgi:hypothetical protein
VYEKRTCSTALLVFLTVRLTAVKAQPWSICEYCAGTSRGPSVAFDLFPGSTPQLPSEEDFGEFSSFEKEEPPEFCLGNFQDVNVGGWHVIFPLNKPNL